MIHQQPTTHTGSNRRCHWAARGAAWAWVLTNAIAGVVLAVLGFLLVLDRLSLRELLAATGPEPARQLVLATHATIAHPGAQVAELAGGLIGVVLVMLSIRTFRRARPA